MKRETSESTVGTEGKLTFPKIPLAIISRVYKRLTGSDSCIQWLVFDWSKEEKPPLKGLVCYVGSRKSISETSSKTVFLRKRHSHMKPIYETYKPLSYESSQQLDFLPKPQPNKENQLHYFNSQSCSVGGAIHSIRHHQRLKNWHQPVLKAANMLRLLRHSTSESETRGRSGAWKVITKLQKSREGSGYLDQCLQVSREDSVEPNPVN